ncbi:MAG: cell division protein ZapA [Bacteroidales bacterium]|nr:cell division protein ZapA [Bacteroidales bacterium]
MAGVSDTLSITLKLGGRILPPMTIKREDEEVYRNAEKLINQRFSYYANTYPQLGSEMYLTMMALDIAVQLKSAESSQGPLTDTIKQLVGEIEASLEQK